MWGIPCWWCWWLGEGRCVWQCIHMNEGRRWENIPKSEIHLRKASGEPAELSLRMRIKVRQKSRACANCKSSRMCPIILYLCWARRHPDALIIWSFAHHKRLCHCSTQTRMWGLTYGLPVVVGLVAVGDVHEESSQETRYEQPAKRYRLHR